MGLLSAGQLRTTLISAKLFKQYVMQKLIFRDLVILLVDFLLQFFGAFSKREALVVEPLGEHNAVERWHF